MLNFKTFRTISFGPISALIGNESNKPIVFGTNNAEQMRLMASGNFVLGSTTDGNIRLDLAKSGSSGTFRCYDQTASTGVTQCTFRAGAGQSTTSILSVQNNSAANLLSIVSSGTSYFKPSSDSTTPFQVQNAAGSAFANFDSTNQVSTFGNNGTAGVGLSIQRQSSRYDQSTYNTYGSTYIAGATGYTAVNQFDENTGLFAYYVSTASVAAGATSTFNVGYTVSAAGNASFLGNVAPLNGATTIYRCSVAGTLRVGQLTSVSADCGTAVDTGLRTP